MPKDVLDAIEAQKANNPNLDLDSLIEKASKSNEVMSVLDSIVKSLTASGESLDTVITKVVKDFNAYDAIVTKSSKSTSQFNKELGSIPLGSIASLNAEFSYGLSLLSQMERQLKRFNAELDSTRSFAGIGGGFNKGNSSGGSAGVNGRNRVGNNSSGGSVIEGGVRLSRFQQGGRVSGNSKTGDKNLARVNSGEWILTEKQMTTLASQLGAKSHNDVFRMAGGIPGRKERDSSGTEKFALGGVKGTSISNRIAGAREGLANRYDAKGTRSSTKLNIESSVDALDELNTQLERISNADLSRLGIDKDLDEVFKKIRKGTVSLSADVNVITSKIVNDVKAQETAAKAAKAAADTQAEAARQAALAAELLAPIDLSRFAGDALVFAENMERAKLVLNSANSTAAEKREAGRVVSSNKSMLELSQRQNLTRAQKAQRADIINRFNAAPDQSSREQIVGELSHGELSMTDSERAIGAMDARMTQFGRTTEATYDQIRDMLGGTPVGMMAVGVAIGYAVKQTAEWASGLSDTVEGMAKLSIETDRLRNSFDSTFGAGQYDTFRESMSLTRKEMAALAPTITDAYRSAGVELEAVSAIAENIKNSFGELDTGKLNEALSIASELTGDQMQILIKGGGGASDDKMNMYANLMASGKAGAAADLIEQGVFGGDEAIKGMSEADREIVENLRWIKTTGDDISFGLKDSLGKVVAWGIPIAQGLGTLGTIGAGVYQAGVTAKVTYKLLEGMSTRLVPPILVRQQPQPNAGGGGGANVAPGAGGRMTMLKGAGAAAAGTAIVAAVTTGLNMISDHYEKKSQVKETKAANERERTFKETGFFDSGAGNLEIDYDKVAATSAKYAAVGAGIAGTTAIAGLALANTAAAVGSGGTSLAGTAATLPGQMAIVGGATAGGGIIGGGIGAGVELERQLGDKSRNPLYRKEGAKEDANWKQTLIPIIGPIIYGVNKTNDFLNAGEKLDTQLLKELTESKKLTKSLRDGAEKNRRYEVKGLRLMESTGIVVGKIKSGAYTRFYDQQTETAQKNLGAMEGMGGDSAQYGAAVATILDSSTKSFAKNSDVISKKMQEVTSKEGISAEARINAQRALLDQQAEITRKFVDSVSQSIGKYDKIPEVIQNSIRMKLAELKLGETTKNFAGTTRGTVGTLTSNLKMAGENAILAQNQYDAEKPLVDAAVKAAKAQSDAARANYESNKGVLSDMGIADFYGKDGKADKAAMTAGRAKLTERREAVDKRAEDLTGVQNYTYTAQRMEEIKGSSAKLKESYDKVDKMTEVEFKADKEGIIGQLPSTLEDMIAQLQSVVSDEGVDKVTKDKTRESLITLQTQQNKYAGLAKDGKLDQKAITDIYGVVSEIMTKGAKHFEDRTAKAAGDASIVKEREQIGQADTVMRQAESAFGAETLALKSLADMEMNLIESLKGVGNAASALANAVNADSTVNTYKMMTEITEANSGYIMEMGQAAEYNLQLMRQNNAQQAAMAKAVAESSKEIENMKKELDKGLEKAKGSASAAGADYLNAMQALNDKRMAAFRDPNSVDPSELKRLESEADALAAKVSPEEMKTLERIVIAATEVNAGIAEVNKNAALTRSMAFENFKKMISNMDSYKNSLDYMKNNMKMNALQSQGVIAGKNMDFGKLDALAEQMRTTAQSRYASNKEALDKDYKNQQALLQEELASATTPEAKKAAQDKIETSTSNYQDKIAQEQNALIEGQQNATRLELDARHKALDITRQNLDTQVDLAQSIGAPMETIVALERQRVDMAKEELALAEAALDRAVTEEERREAGAKVMKAQAEVVKAQLGAQRSMMEKTFGNMIGAFSEVNGIQGPGNLARKYGMGYTQSPDGTVAKGGKATGGYRDRLFTNNAAGTPATAGGAATRQTDAKGQPVAEKGKDTKAAPPAQSGAPKKSSGDADFNKLGETFGDQKQAIEMVVFWEKKIYNLLSDQFNKENADGIRAQRGDVKPSAPIDATKNLPKNEDPRNKPKVEPAHPTKGQGAAGIQQVPKDPNAPEEAPENVFTEERATMYTGSGDGHPEETYNEMSNMVPAEIEAMHEQEMRGENPYAPQSPIAAAKKPTGSSHAEVNGSPMQEVTKPPAPANTVTPQGKGHDPNIKPPSNFMFAPSRKRGLDQLLPEGSAKPGAAGVGAGSETGTGTGGKLDVNIQVKFDNKMFEEQVKRFVLSPSVSKEIVATTIDRKV